MSEGTLVPGNAARLGEVRFEDWLIRDAKQAPKAGERGLSRTADPL